MSLEELATSNGVVVCPQCLGEFVAKDVDLSGVKVPERKTASPEPHHAAAPASDAVEYCHHCGKHLPAAGLSFCPYCGGSLSFDTADSAQPAPEARLGAGTAQVPAEPQSRPAATGDRANDGEVNTDLLNRPLRLRPELRSHDFKEEPASLPVRIICTIVIIVLIAIFIFIVYKGNME